MYEETDASGGGKWGLSGALQVEVHGLCLVRWDTDVRVCMYECKNYLKNVCCVFDSFPTTVKPAIFATLSRHYVILCCPFHTCSFLVQSSLKMGKRKPLDRDDSAVRKAYLLNEWKNVITIILYCPLRAYKVIKTNIICIR